MNDTDQYGATAGTSGVRAPRRRPPQTLGGSAVATVLALAALFVATAAPALLAGVAIGAVGGAAVAVLSGRRRRAETVDFCLPRASLCLSI
ncbi:hypothetical protein [Halolamina salifodinae]|uniref:Uncharacterized protein n=1 Tax=Halolamina salifodinae TaxID=1202767 RepID=A0A8T4GZX0_9EURY|nr:hypothetical protein [Halolamina salifodinae]MBP1986895.1 hypothetical protein [Halolamina salifodinae]